MKWLIGTVVVVTALFFLDSYFTNMFDTIFDGWFMGAV